MKAEEYIKSRELSIGAGISDPKVYLSHALSAISMAREEEREKVKNLIREAYNALNGGTGLDPHLDDYVRNESSLSRRLREYLEG